MKHAFNALGYLCILFLILIQSDEYGNMLINGHKGLLYAIALCVTGIFITLVTGFYELEKSVLDKLSQEPGVDLGHDL